MAHGKYEKSSEIGRMTQHPDACYKFRILMNKKTTSKPESRLFSQCAARYEKYLNPFQAQA